MLIGSDDCFKRGETSAQELINQALQNENITNPEFGAAETRAIKLILEKWQLDRLSLLSIATKDNNNRWDQKLESITKKFRNEIQISNGKGVVKQTIKYLVIVCLISRNELIKTRNLSTPNMVTITLAKQRNHGSILRL